MTTRGTVFSPLPLELLFAPNLPQLGVGEEDGRSIEERVMGLMRAVEIREGGARPSLLGRRKNSGRSVKEEIVETVGGLRLEEDEGGGSDGLTSRGEGEAEGGREEVVLGSLPLKVGAEVEEALGLIEELEFKAVQDLMGEELGVDEVEDEMKGSLLEAGWGAEEVDEGGLRSSESGQGSLWV
ncbi:hypothetical protein BDY24DRAFT_438798 [Mrakia frigida]|uniref:uncharacterized protein n=1 Tax=Mrakia frigida TaxID=29902 RepID=UPI003FCC19C9